MTSTRIDKWLWAARFFKTRALASHACDLGRIEANSLKAKPARDVKPGDLLRIRNDAGEYQVEVLAISDVRGPAATAQTLFCESQESQAARAKETAERKALHDSGAVPASRPSKRDRSQFNRLRGRS
jgi:ribosome-associated heat shock protein Hsp15